MLKKKVVQTEALRKMKHTLDPVCLLVLEMERDRWARIVILCWPVTK